MPNLPEINQSNWLHTYSLNDYNQSIVSHNYEYRIKYIQDILRNQEEVIPNPADIEPLATDNVSRLTFKCFQLANCPPSSTFGRLIQMNVGLHHLTTLQEQGKDVPIIGQVTSARDGLVDKIFGNNEREKAFYQSQLVTSIQGMQSGGKTKSPAEKTFKDTATSIKQNFYNGWR